MKNSQTLVKACTQLYRFQVFRGCTQTLYSLSCSCAMFSNLGSWEKVFGVFAFTAWGQLISPYYGVIWIIHGEGFSRSLQLGREVQVAMWSSLVGSRWNFRPKPKDKLWGSEISTRAFAKCLKATGWTPREHMPHRHIKISSCFIFLNIYQLKCFYLYVSMSSYFLSFVYNLELSWII